MFPKRNRHPYPKSPDDRSNKVGCKCLEFLIDSVDVTLVYSCSGAQGGSGSSESSKKSTHTFFERMGCSSHQKIESVVLQTDLLLLSDLVCRN